MIGLGPETMEDIAVPFRQAGRWREIGLARRAGGTLPSQTTQALALAAP